MQALNLTNLNEKILYQAKRTLRYYLVTWGIISLGIIGLLYYMVIWPNRLPKFLVNDSVFFLMKLSGVIFSLVLLYLIYVSFRDFRGSIILTDKKLILTHVKSSEAQFLPLKKIIKINLGRSPLERLCGCSSLWISANETESGYLLGPLDPIHANELAKLLTDLTGKSSG